MVLKADHTLAGKTVFGCILPFATSLAGKPVLAPGFKFNYLLAVEPVFNVAVVKEDSGVVPLTCRFDDCFLRIGGVMA